MGKYKVSRFWILATLCTFLFCGLEPSYAQSTDVGTTTAKFLKIGLGSRASGMGGAFTGLGEGIESVFWNPAGLARIKMKEFATGYNMWFEDVSGLYIAAGYPFKNGKGALGFNFNQWNMGQIEVTSTSSTIERYASVTQGFIGLTYSYALTPNFLAGITGKYIYQDLIISSVNGGAADVGFLAIMFENFRVGISAQNFGVVQATGSTSDILPWSIKVGASVSLQGNFTIAVDADYPKDNGLKVHAGFEYLIKGEGDVALVLRAGYNQAEVTTASGATNISGLTLGLGIKSGVGEVQEESPLNMDLDYAYIPYGGLGTTHRISLIMRF